MSEISEFSNYYNSKDREPKVGQLCEIDYFGPKLARYRGDSNWETEIKIVKIYWVWWKPYVKKDGDSIPWLSDNI